ncbi:zinc transporter ZIP14-like [Mizuhopecten yessoensis]|uniref:Zinc transporter ZIP14 n=1 Tax=Mizuhopecten yessoensis TaxID=6573 RepID=A0A210R4W0_MIZYE|nr:zinc transporter ZIP14-like [Mizuhopecten yessoensis]OWF56005.1 Zinc transporter ZIP14 [Mizuhopecten yessoensis]
MATVQLVFIAVVFLVATQTGRAAECETNISSILSELENEAQSKQGSMTASDVYQAVYEWVPLSHRNVTEQCLHQGFNKTQCLLNKCLTFQEILRLYDLNDTSALSKDDIQELSPLLSLIAKAKSCDSHNKSVDDERKEEGKHKAKSSMVKAWGYGFLFVTIINICSLAGAMVLPFMKRAVYRQLLIFMIGLAVGTLAANGLLVLIPEALGLMYIEDHAISSNYVWKTTTVMGGIYLFFLIERVLKLLLSWRERRRDGGYQSDGADEDEDMYSSIKKKTPITTTQKYKNPKNLPGALPLSNSETPLTDDDSQDNVLSTINVEVKPQNGSTAAHAKRPIATVAWMIIFGDGIHNFIDGLSIGAAFTDSTLAGISISLGIICEELPHELGDFAILINAGMSMKKALMYNFLSACMCYLGLIVGTLLGENTTAHDWIFAIAGGMFLYISLVDMMPEMNSESENEETKRLVGTTRIFLLQNGGMLLGFTIILLMTLYGGQINFGE